MFCLVFGKKTQKLVKETLKENKPSSTFKAKSFIKVTTEINQKFNVQYEAKLVDNHLKIVKKKMRNNNQTLK
jgi:hypothetical protein